MVQYLVLSEDSIHNMYIYKPFSSKIQISINYLSHFIRNFAQQHYFEDSKPPNYIRNAITYQAAFHNYIVLKYLHHLRPYLFKLKYSKHARIIFLISKNTKTETNNGLHNKFKGLCHEFRKSIRI